MTLAVPGRGLYALWSCHSYWGYPNLWLQWRLVGLAWRCRHHHFRDYQQPPSVSPEDIGLEPSDGRTRANHKHKFRTRGARTNSYKYSFASRTISEWNRLPASIVEADSPQAFKAGLATLAPVAPEMPWSGTHPSALYTTGWPADNGPRQDKTSLRCLRRAGFGCRM